MTETTNIDLEIDQVLLGRVLDRFGLRTATEAVDLALRRLAEAPMTAEEALALEGTGWDGDLDAMRRSRPVDL